VPQSLHTAFTDTLEIAYLEYGDPAGEAVLLLHGFPYDPSAFEAIAPVLGEEGLRVIVPYLRGYGPTRFLDPHVFRGGEQAAIADDAIGLLDALGIGRALVCGFDWGGRAGCIMGALWPERVRGLVVAGGYLIQNIAKATTAGPIAIEQRIWHQYFLASERGRNALAADRRGLALHFRAQWSPNWHGHDAAVERAAPAFDNPDFVAVVWHSYAHRIGAAPGEDRYRDMEEKLSALPEVGAPAIVIRGGDLGVGGSGPPKFAALVDERIDARAGHNPAQETPEIVLKAVCDLLGATDP
jgi:pimeloyl-ACP methyl ester carboxylesterase